MDRLPWWAWTLSSPSRSASWWATLSAILRVLTNTSVVRCRPMCAAIRSQHRGHLLVGRHGTQLVVGELDGDVKAALMADVDGETPGISTWQRPLRAGTHQ